MVVLNPVIQYAASVYVLYIKSLYILYNCRKWFWSSVFHFHFKSSYKALFVCIWNRFQKRCRLVINIKYTRLSFFYLNVANNFTRSLKQRDTKKWDGA